MKPDMAVSSDGGGAVCKVSTVGIVACQSSQSCLRNTSVPSLATSAALSHKLHQYSTPTTTKPSIRKNTQSTILPITKSPTTSTAQSSISPFTQFSNLHITKSLSSSTSKAPTSATIQTTTTTIPTTTTTIQTTTPTTTQTTTPSTIKYSIPAIHPKQLFLTNVQTLSQIIQQSQSQEQQVLQQTSTIQSLEKKNIKNNINTTINNNINTTTNNTNCCNNSPTTNNTTNTTNNTTPYNTNNNTTNYTTNNNTNNNTNTSTKTKPSLTLHTIPTRTQKTSFHHNLLLSSSLLFHSKSLLPLQSSPVPNKRLSSGSFDYDCNLNSVNAIKNSLSLGNLGRHGLLGNKKTSSSPPNNCLLGSFEESVMQGRIEAAGVVEGFKVEIGASGSFHPPHITLPCPAFFFSLSEAPSPYLGHVNLESHSKKGYRIPVCGTIQLTLFNPNNSVVKIFVIRYDVADMPAYHQTLLRQRTVYMATPGSKSDVPSSSVSLRYLVHLRLCSTKPGRIYLHTDIRLIFARERFELDSRVAHYELRSFTEIPQNPTYSPHNTLTSSPHNPPTTSANNNNPLYSTPHDPISHIPATYIPHNPTHNGADS